MSKTRDAVYAIHQVDNLAADRKRTDGLHPLAKLTVTVCYIMTVVSFGKYDLPGLTGMVLYPLILFLVWEIPVRRCIRQIWAVLLLVCLVGTANPIFDRSPLVCIGGFIITGGMISMVTLMLKGVFSVLASYILISTAGMEQICYALRCLHVPKGFVTVLLLIYRYIIVMLKEVESMSDAYRLRAPGQRGINIRAWGPFAGQLLLRSMDRAETVYESMALRGYDGEFKGSRFEGSTIKSILYFIIWTGAFILLRRVPLFEAVGSLFV